MDEFYANDTGAKGESLDKIRTALTTTAEWLKVPPAKAWTSFPDPKRCFYQCANRFAHLILLRDTLGVPPSGNPLIMLCSVVVMQKPVKECIARSRHDCETVQTSMLCSTKPVER